MNNEPGLAWEAYVRMDTSNESFNLLHLIANDCYKMGHFYYACKVDLEVRISKGHMLDAKWVELEPKKHQIYTLLSRLRVMN